jgi:hypothetical protein
MSTTRTDPESGQRIGGVEVEACGFELLFDGAVDQEGDRPRP